MLLCCFTMPLICVVAGDLDGALKTSAKILSTILPSEEMSNMLRELPAAFQDTYYRWGPNNIWTPVCCTRHLEKWHYSRLT